MRTYWSIGNIVSSRFWLSLELRPGCGRGFWLGKTYNGTKTGIVWSFGFGSIIGHVR